MQIKIKILEGAVLPVRGTSGSAGYDLSAPLTMEKKELKVGERMLIKTGVFMEIPTGMYGRVAPRSGLAFKHGIAEMAGVIDSDYRDEIGVILINHDKEKSLIINPGDRIAQLILEHHAVVDFNVVSDLSDTTRGVGGFGSTGMTKL